MVTGYSLRDVATRLGDMTEAHRHLKVAKACFFKIGREIGGLVLEQFARSLEATGMISGIAKWDTTLIRS
jgi:hypothetical protein